MSASAFQFACELSSPRSSRVAGEGRMVFQSHPLLPMPSIVSLGRFPERQAFVEIRAAFQGCDAPISCNQSVRPNVHFASVHPSVRHAATRRAEGN